MNRHHSRVRRRPFLTPIWLSVFGALLALGLLGFLGLEAWLWATADPTFVIVVRHAEKAAEPASDPPLSAAGEERARRLAQMFGNGRTPGDIDAIYVSSALRNRMTAAPLAARLGLSPVVASTEDPGALARRLLHEHAGGRILVVGHADTIPALVEALSGIRGLPSIGADEYGTMYLITVPRIGRAAMLRLAY